jgi:hypothetical protein
LLVHRFIVRFDAAGRIARWMGGTEDLRWTMPLRRWMETT